LIRCWETVDEGYIRYHDEEWGRPVRDERGIYERLCLEGFQSGLSWLTILRKRPAFRSAFAGFDPDAVAAFGEADVERLLGDAGIVRHRGKIEAAIANARATVALRKTADPLHELFWSHAPAAVPPAVPSLADLPATTPESIALAKRLGRRASGSSARPPCTRPCKHAAS
jgi:DNA-3-methyladenine glycosylase I